MCVCITYTHRPTCTQNTYTYICTERERYIGTHRQRDTQIHTGTWTHRHTDTYTEIDTHPHRYTYIQTYMCMHIHTTTVKTEAVNLEDSNMRDFGRRKGKGKM